MEKEYYEKNKKKILEKRKIYYIKNREKILKKRKVYREEHPEVAVSWREKNPDYQGEWYQKNKEKCLKQSKKYYKNNREKHSEYCKKYYITNKDKALRRWKKYYKKNRKKIVDKTKKYYKDNKKEMDKYRKIWKEENVGRCLENTRESRRKWTKTERGRAHKQRGSVKRRTRERNIINTLTYQEWLDILESYGYRCAYCGCEFNKDNPPTRDHVISINNGGHNIKENIVPACRSCNSKKGAKNVYILK